MLVLRDHAEIHAEPRAVYDWFRSLVDNYRDWHPNHVSCRYVRGNSLEVGSVLYAEEYLHGRLHKLRLKLTSVEPDRAFSYRIAPGLQGDIRIRPTKSGAQLEAEIRIGWSLPVIGPLGDLIVRKFFSTTLEDLRVHMREEGRNLSMLLNAQKKTSARQDTNA